MKPIEISILDLANELKRLANGVVREVQRDSELACLSNLHAIKPLVQFLSETLANELQLPGHQPEVQQVSEPESESLKNPIGFSQPTCSSKDEVKGEVVTDGLDARHDNLRQAITEHFSEKCEPSVPLYMVDLALEAIDAVLRGEGSALIDLPPGVTWRNELVVTAQSAVDSLYLAAFVDYERDYAGIVT
jgi:hypothetical protein